MNPSPLPTNPDSYADGFYQAERDMNDGLAKLGDPGFQPPRNKYQQGYNDCIEAPCGPDVIGVALLIALGVAIITALYMVLTLCFPAST